MRMFKYVYACRGGLCVRVEVYQYVRFLSYENTYVG